MTEYKSPINKGDQRSAWRRIGRLTLAVMLAILVGIAFRPAVAQASDSEQASALKPFQVAQARYYRVYQPRYRSSVRHVRARAVRTTRRVRTPRTRYTTRRRSVRRKTRRAAKPLLPVSKPNAGPVQLVVSLKRQRVTVYQNGNPVSSSRISTGRDGHNTPSGIFSIIQKHRRHYSNIYRGASMPYMQRITWSGIALHGGNVPGYRASHGCIRLPHRFAKSLFRYTSMGAHVVVANGDPSPREISHAKLFRPTPPVEILPQHRPATPVALSPADGLEGHQIDLVRLASLAPAHTTTDAIVGLKTAQPAVDAAAAARMLGATEGKIARAAAYVKRSKSPIRILLTRRTGRERVRDAQRLLARLGYDVGIPDGLVGKQTIKAIKIFQKANDRPPIGYPNELFYDDLYRASGLKQPTDGHLYVRQDFKTVFDAPIVLKDANAPLGTHFFMLMHFEPGETAIQWRAMTLKARGRLPRSRRKTRKNTKAVSVGPAMTAAQALDRFEIPAHVRTRISDILTPGSSVIITDRGISHETGRGTDFVVLTR